MSTRKILLGWELGEGLGYSVQLRELAKSMQQYGHAPTVALRSIETAHILFSECSFPVLQSPYVIGRLTPTAQRDGFFPVSFADLMACNGFGSEDHLYSMVRGWRHLIDVVKPDLIIGMYCPLLTMAAYGRIPVVLFGPGYATPPADGHAFPVWQTDVVPYSNPSRTLEIVQRVQQRFGAPQPTCLTEIYRGEKRLITTLPELDPYRSCRNDPCVGAFEKFSPPVPVHSDKFYAYLAGATDLSHAVVSKLMNCGMRGNVFVRDADVTSWEIPTSKRVSIHDTVPNLEEITRDSAVIIHHGGIGTTHAALAAGRPQVLVPQVFDQVLTADALVGFPFISSVIHSMNSELIMTAMQSLLGNRDSESAALEFAHSIQTRGLHNAQDLIISASLEFLR